MFSTLVSLGALTSKVSAYKYRSWELETKATIDYFDSLGIIGNACIKGLTILRILPNNSSNIFDWLSDKFRFSFDSVLENRNLRVLYKKEEISLFRGLQVIVDFLLDYTNVQFSLGKTLDVLDTLVIKDISNYFNNCNYIYDSFNNLSQMSLDQRVLNYINFEEANFFKNLIIWGLDLRLEFPVLENFYFNKLKFDDIYVIGVTDGGGFNLGMNILSHWLNFFNGTSVLVKNILKKASLFFSGVSLFGRYAFDEAFLNFVYIFFANLQKIYKQNLKKLCLLNAYMSDINFFEIGLVSKKIGGLNNNNMHSSLLFVVESTDVIFSKKNDFSVCFSAYNRNENINQFDLVFPLVASVEKNIISYSVQGILNFCEKLRKQPNSFNIFSYVHMVKSICKYALSLGFVSKLLNNVMKKKYLLNIFLVLFEKKISILNNLYIACSSFTNMWKLPVFFIDVTLTLQNTTLNYFYTHVNLLYSPTILLADARIKYNTFLDK